jgi:hypothetical protein
MNRIIFIQIDKFVLRTQNIFKFLCQKRCASIKIDDNYVKFDQIQKFLKSHNIFVWFRAILRGGENSKSFWLNIQKSNNEGPMLRIYIFEI